MQFPFIPLVFIVPQVHKVRFVASTLLDAVRKAETAPASAARAHAYLCEDNFMFRIPIAYHTSGDFLSILSEIERNYLFVAWLSITPHSLTFLSD